MAFSCCTRRNSTRAWRLASALRAASICRCAIAFSTGGGAASVDARMPGRKIVGRCGCTLWIARESRSGAETAPAMAGPPPSAPAGDDGRHGDDGRRGGGGGSVRIDVSMCSRAVACIALSAGRAVGTSAAPPLRLASKVVAAAGSWMPMRLEAWRQKRAARRAMASTASCAILEDCALSARHAAKVASGAATPGGSSGAAGGSLAKARVY